MSHKVFLFGYGRHGKSIASGLVLDGYKLTIIESDEAHYLEAIADGFEDSKCLDVTQDADLESLVVKQSDQLICVMDDERLNVFLTLSLRPLFPDSNILAISDSIYNTQKLQMAGANRVIDLYEVAANRIHNLLKRPASTRFLDKILSDHNGINFRELIVPKGSFLDGMMADDINFSAYRVLLLGLVDLEQGKHFIFITNGDDHKLNGGDRIICLGQDEDLDRFEKKIGAEEMIE